MKKYSLLYILTLLSMLLTVPFSVCSANSNQIGFYDRNEVAIFKEDGFYGLINNEGMILAEAEYDKIFIAKGLNLPSSDSYGWYLYKKGNETGCINKEGIIVKHKPEWNDSGNDYFTGNLMVIQNTVTGKYNICTLEGELLFDLWYNKITPIPNGGALIEDEHGIKRIDDNGKIIAQVHTDGETVSRCTEQYVYTYDSIHKTSILRTISDLSVIISDCKFIDPSGFHDGLILARQGDKIGFFDENGIQAIPFIYELGSNGFSFGKAVVKDDENTYVINTNGDVLYEADDDSICLGACFSEQGVYYLIEAEHIWGFMDEYGNRLCQFDENQYTMCPDIEDHPDYHTIHDEVTDRYGVIKTDGTIILDTIYNSIGNFENEYTYAHYGSFFGIIDTQGEWVSTPQWTHVDMLIPKDGNVYVVGRKELDSEEQVYNLEGEQVCPYFWNNSKW